MKGQKRIIKQDGITLVTLIITIIVMLILAGVIINITTDENDIFDTAEEATGKWNNRITTEDNAMQNLLAKRNEILGGTTGDENEGSGETPTEPTTPPETQPDEGSIILNKSSLTLEIVDGANSEEVLVATKQNLTETVSWTSSVPTVATVDSNGKVTTVGAGTTTITANCGDKSATCEVTVKEFATLTLQGEGGYYFIRLTKQDGMVYAETYDTYDMKVEVNQKVAFPKVFSGSSAENIVRIFPQTVEEYEKGTYYSVIPIDEMPAVGRFNCSGLDEYKTLEGGNVDIDNLYITEKTTIRCIYD